MRLGGGPSPFHPAVVTNESGKESWRTEGLFVFEREFQRCTGEQAKVVKPADREGELGGAPLSLKL